MPKVRLEFDLPLEQEEFEHAIKGMSAWCVIWDLDQELRQLLKYGHSYKTADEALTAVRKQLHSFCEDNDIKLG